MSTNLFGQRQSGRTTRAISSAIASAISSPSRTSVFLGIDAAHAKQLVSEVAQAAPGFMISPNQGSVSIEPPTLINWANLYGPRVRHAVIYCTTTVAGVVTLSSPMENGPAYRVIVGSMQPLHGDIVDIERVHLYREGATAVVDSAVVRSDCVPVVFDHAVLEADPRVREIISLLHRFDC